MRRQKERNEINTEKYRCQDGKKSEKYNRYSERTDIERIIFIAAGVGVLAGLVLFGFAASMIVRPIFVYRYMIPALGCFWLSFAVGLGHMFVDRKAAALIITSFVLVVGLRDYRAFMGEEEYKILLMEQTKEALSSIAAEDIVIYNFDQVQAVKY